MKKYILPLILTIVFIPSLSLADTKEDLQESRAKLNELSDKMIDNTLKKDDLSDKIKNNESEIAKLSKSIKEDEDKIAKRKMDLGKSVREEQINQSSNNIISTILSGESTSDIIKGIFVKSTLANAKSDKIDSINESKKELEKSVDKLNKEKEELTKNKEQLDKVTSDLESQDSKLKSDIESLETKYASEIAEENKITNAVQSSQEKVLDLPTGSALKSGDAKAQSSIIATASQFIGVPYVFGGSSPSGFDCSGFTSYVFSLHGISLPRIASDQSLQGTAVSLDNLQVGDLVFWGGVGSAYHVGIYAGNNTYIHAPTEGQTVKYSSMDYYMPDSARRVM